MTNNLAIATEAGTVVAKGHTFYVDSTHTYAAAGTETITVTITTYAQS